MLKKRVTKAKAVCNGTGVDGVAAAADDDDEDHDDEEEYYEVF